MQNGCPILPTFNGGKAQAGAELSAGLLTGAAEHPCWGHHPPAGVSAGVHLLPGSMPMLPVASSVTRLRPACQRCIMIAWLPFR